MSTPPARLVDSKSASDVERDLLAAVRPLRPDPAAKKRIARALATAIEAEEASAEGETARKAEK